MKLESKFLSGFPSALAVALIALLNASPSQAAFVSLPNLTPNQGSTFVVPVTVSPDLNVSGFQFQILFDPSVLSYVGIASQPLPGSYSVAPNAGPGTLGVTYDSISDTLVASGNPIISLNFQATGGASTTSFLNFGSLPPHTISSLSGPISATWQNGSIEVVPEPINVALGIFGCMGITAVGARKLWLRRSI